MKILLTGATGFVGKKLVAELSKRGHEIVLLSRDKSAAEKKFPFKVTAFNWNPKKEEAPLEAFAGVNAVVNLLGEPVASGRWTEEKKKEIYDSRIIGTKNLLASIQKLSGKPSVIVSASAIGIYGDRGGEELTEASPLGTDFLAGVCKDWEKEASVLSTSVRTVLIRIGIVLGDDGALDKMLPAFKLGLGGPIGNGKQVMSWIGIDDLVGIFCFALENEKITGAFNAVAPEPVTNKAFSSQLGQALHRPAVFPVPALGLRLIFGEMAAVLLGSQKVSCKKILEAGYDFKGARLLSVLQRAIGH